MSTLLRSIAVAYFGFATATALATPTLDAALAYSDSVELGPAFVTDRAELAPGRQAIEPASAYASLSDEQCCSGVDCGSDVDFDLGCGCPSLWTVRAGAVVMHRSRPNEGVIARTDPGGVPVSNAADFSFDWAGGPDVSIIRRTARGNAWELRYFGVLNSTATRAYGDPGNFQIPPVTFLNLDDLNAEYSTTLHSTELNWLHPVTPRVALIAGFRWVEISDDLNYVVGYPGLQEINLRSNVNNRLYGAQTGADVSLWNRGGPLTMNGVIKAGVYGNTADNVISSVNSFTGVDSIGSFRSAAPTSFVGEINLVATYQLTKHIALRGGYQLLWLDQLGLASNSLIRSIEENEPYMIDTDGSLFYNGAMMGGEFAW